MTMKRKITGMALALALAAAGGFSCTNRGASEAGSRSPSADEDDRAVQALNAEILKVTEASQVSDTLDRIVDLAKNQYPRSSAAAFYSEIAAVTKPLKGVLWRLGGVAVQSEMLYSVLVGAVVGAKQSNHLYSKPVNALLDWATQPVTSAQGLPYPNKTRLTSMRELQDFLRDYSARLEHAAGEIEKIYNQNPRFEFWFHRALIAPVPITSSYSGRRVRFIRPYLAAGLSATYYSLASIKAIVAHNLDDLPLYLNQMTHEQLKGTGLGVARLDLRQRAMQDLNRIGIDVRALQYRNVTVNTAMDYGVILKEYPELFKWRSDTGRTTRDEALPLVRKAAALDVEWATEMQKFDDGRNQDEYVVDAHLKMADPVYKLSHYQEIQKLVLGPTQFVDPVSGDLTRVNFPAVFQSDQPIRHFLPTEWVNQPANWANRNKVFRKMVNGLPTFDFTLGQASNWQDPTFGGLLPDATRDNLRELQRRLIFNDDSSQFMGTLLYFFI